MVTALRVIGILTMILGGFVAAAIRLSQPSIPDPDVSGTSDFITVLMFFSSIIAGIVFLAFAKVIELLEVIAKK